MPTAPPPPVVAIAITTISANTDAAAFARTLVEERLAACVNILPPMTSIYRWQGNVSEDREHQLVMKTTTDRLATLEARIRELHAYDVPEFLVIAVSGGADAYRAWVGESTR